jgi:hypothetical protein
MTSLLLGAAGRRRSPATMPGFHAGRPPRNKGHRYLRRTAATAGVRRRSAALRATSAAPRACRRDGARGRAAHRHPGQLGHSNLGITSIYLQGIDNAEIIEAVHARRAPMVPVSASLRL